MATFGPVSLPLLKTILELDGYALVIDDPFCWVLARASGDPAQAAPPPIILLRTDRIVAADELTRVLRQAGISDEAYGHFREIVRAARVASPLAN